MKSAKNQRIWKLGLAFLLGMVLMQSGHLSAQQNLVGHWQTPSVERGRELNLILEDQGQAYLTVSSVQTGFAETIEGDCKVITTRVTEATLAGTYKIASNSLVFRWDKTPPRKLFGQQRRNWIWAYQLADKLVVSANGDSYTLSKMPVE